MAVIHITENEFEEKVLKNNKPAFVDFFAIDIDDAEETAAKYGVMSIPNMVLFKNGEVADRIIGKTGKQGINEFVRK